MKYLRWTCNWAALIGAICLIGCESNPKESEFEFGNAMHDIAPPLMIGEQPVAVRLGDYLVHPDQLDSVDATEGVMLDWTTGGDSLLISGTLKEGIGSMRFYVKGKAYHVPLRVNPNQPVSFGFHPFVHYDSVFLVGDFNGWDPQKHRMQWDGSGYTAVLDLLPGEYSYQLVVNGEYMLDPNNPETKSNGMGGFNSVRRVLPENDHKKSLKFTLGKAGSLVAKLDEPAGQIMVLFDNHLLDHQWRNDSLVLKLPNMDDDQSRHCIRVFAGDPSGTFQAWKFPTAGSSILTSTEQLNRNDKERTIMYFMMVDRFVNGDRANDEPLQDDRVAPRANYQGGDLVGIQKVLESGYFDSLGINTLWISPITQNPLEAYQEYPEPRRFYSGYHGYWPIRFTTVDHRFGTGEELSSLISSVHQRNKNIILDFVSNHVHEKHPFIEANPRYATDLMLPDGSKNLRLWDQQRLTTWFDEFLPSFDFSRSEVVDVVSDSALFWLKTYDFDGFRHDATKHIPTHYWRTVTSKVRDLESETGKDYFQVGETFGDRALIQSYVGPGMMDGQFDFNLYFDLRNALSGQGGSMKSVATSLDASLIVHGPLHSMCNITGNHDLTRFISIAGRGIRPGEDEKEVGWERDIQVEDTLGYHRLKLLQTFIGTVPGIPVIYYGDEIGMPGANDPDNRRMMRFDDLNRHEKRVKEHLSQVLKLRASSMALTLGSIQWIFVDEEVVIYERAYLDERVIVALNNGAQEVEINTHYPTTNDAWKSINPTEFQMVNDRLFITLPALSSTCIINESNHE